MVEPHVEDGEVITSNHTQTSQTWTVLSTDFLACEDVSSCSYHPPWSFHRKSAESADLKASPHRIMAQPAPFSW